MTDRRLIHLLWLPLLGYLGYLGYVLYRLAWFDELSSIANDSVNYLAMARYYSPWLPASEAIHSVWPLQDFPPLFPLLLALTGAAHSLLVAHALVAAMGLLCLPLFYRLAVRWLGDSRPDDSRLAVAGVAILTMVIFSLSPGYLLGLQAILSESMYLLLSLLFFLLYRDQVQLHRGRLAAPILLPILLLSMLLACAMLSRTIGWALWLAVFMQAVIATVSLKKIQRDPLLIVAASAVIYFILQWWLGPDRDSHYIDIFKELLAGNNSSTEAAGLAALWGQALSLLDAWHTFWTVYWVDEYSVTYLIVTVLLFFSLLELLIRLKSNKVDAYYILVYLLILLAWPHPGQMVRLVFPVAPVLILYSVMGVLRAFSFIAVKHQAWVCCTLFGLLLVTVAPSHAFIHGRLNMAYAQAQVPVYEIFRRPDLTRAQHELDVQNRMFADMRVLESEVAEKEIVLYSVPAYIAILANRRSAPYTLVDAMPGKAAGDAPAYLFTTVIHPRKTREGYSGLAVSNRLNGLYEKQWCRLLPDRKPVSCLYKIR